jgi:predicted metal-dependent hydrolase
MSAKQSPNYLAGYPPLLVEQVSGPIAQGKLGELLKKKYPQAHAIRTDKALYDYVQALKDDYLRNAAPISRVLFDNTLHALRHALGTHTRIARVQGSKLKAKREIHIASAFKTMPPEFLRMIVVHELAHSKIREHDKDFYQLCRHMEPDYHQLELDLRAYLLYLDAAQPPLWPQGSPGIAAAESGPPPAR